MLIVLRLRLYTPLVHLDSMSVFPNAAEFRPQVHLAVTGKPDEMRVSWKTQSSSCPSTVHYGETAVNTPPHLFDQLEHRQVCLHNHSCTHA